MAAVLRVAVIQIADEVLDAGGLGEEDLPLGALLGVGRLRAIVNPARRALARARLPGGAKVSLSPDDLYTGCVPQLPFREREHPSETRRPGPRSIGLDRRINKSEGRHLDS